MEKTASLWPQVLDQVRAELSEQSFSTWFSPITCVDISGEKVTLGVPDQFSVDWIRDHYQNLIVSSVSSLLGTSERPALHMEIVEGVEKKTPAHERRSERPETPLDLPKTSLSSLNSTYTFENFVVGSGNRFAQAAAFAVSESPAKRYNPLFIYGSSGLGKTHLMQAIAHELIQRSPGAKALYTSSEKFVNQLVQAIQNRTQVAFRNRYRSVDILLIDDIHFIAGKEATQEEFFHTFNALYDDHKQIVVSSDRPPKDIPGLEERLIGRFAWGLVVDVQPPDLETRLAILRKKVARDKTRVPDDVLNFIASKIKSNIRELEGALLRVLAFASLTGASVTVEAAQGILKDSLLEEYKKITIDLVQKKTAEYYDISISDMRVKRRSKTIAFPRQVAMYLVKQLTSASLPEIGRQFGGKHHTTVLHSINKIEELRRNDKDLNRTIAKLMDALQ